MSVGEAFLFRVSGAMIGMLASDGRFSSTWRALRFCVLLAIAWCVMTFTHELGHIIGGVLSGATLQEVDLAPWRMPFSLYQPNPHPLVTLWTGPVFGIALPLAATLLIRRDWARFIGDFCLLANGVYLAAAWGTGDRLLDTAKLIEHGASRWSIGIFCIVTISVGYVRFRRDCIRALADSPPQRLALPPQHVSENEQCRE